MRRHSTLQGCFRTAYSPPKAGAAGAPNPPPPPPPKPPNAGALPAPKAGVEACPKDGTVEAPNAGALPAPKAGVLDAPNAGVPDAPNTREPDWVAPNAGVLATPNAGAVTGGAPKGGALAAAPKPLLALAPNMPTAALDCAGAEAAPASKAGVLAGPPNVGMLPLLKPMPVLAAGARNPEIAAADAAPAPKVKDEAAAAEEAGIMKEGKPVVEGATGVGPVSSATKGLAAPADPADGDTDMLLSRLRPLPCRQTCRISQSLQGKH